MEGLRSQATLYTTHMRKLDACSGSIAKVIDIAVIEGRKAPRQHLGFIAGAKEDGHSLVRTISSTITSLIGLHSREHELSRERDEIVSQYNVLAEMMSDTSLILMQLERHVKIIMGADSQGGPTRWH